MRIHLHTPRAELQPFVEFIWVLESMPGGDICFPRIPPFGEVELAFHTEQPFQYRGPGESPRSVPAAHVSGPRVRYFDLLPGDRAGFLSVRFRPGAFQRFYPQPLSELTGNVIALEDLTGKDARFILDEIREAEHTAARLELVERYLMACLRARDGGDMFTEAAMDGLYASLHASHDGEMESGAGRIDFMAARLGLSRRSFQRKFKAAFGMSARDYRRLLRFEAMMKDTLRAGARGENPDLGDQALRFGYFDQSHFNKDFREYMGLAPGDYLRADGARLLSII